jgi:predicted nucleotidyltransferase
MTTQDHVLSDFRQKLGDLYGARLEKVVLYGSRARGEARDDSDYDVAVFIKDMNDRWAEIDRLGAMASDILYRDLAVIHAMPYGAGSYQDRTPLMHEIRRDGREI